MAHADLVQPVAQAQPPAATMDDPVPTLTTEAFAHHGEGRLGEAIALYRQIVACRDLPSIRNNLGHALAQQGKFEAAMLEYRRAIELKPNFAEALCNWGVALSQRNRLDDAEARFRKAIAVNPTFAGAYHNLAILLKETGRIEEAQSVEMRAIALAPRNTAYFEHLATMRRFTAGDRYLRALEELADGGEDMGVSDRTHLHFALAKAYEDTRQFEKAFAQLAAGNALKRAHTIYDEAATLARMRRARETFSADFVQSRRRAGIASSLPIFIIGMPRSGTSLIEQILASHPEIYGAGETTAFERAVGALSKALPAAPGFPDIAAVSRAEHFRALGAYYLNEIAQYAPHASRIVDKMPGNFLFTGLIHLALPNATIIHAVRDPLDTCLSCYAILFADQAHTCDLAELGRYYRHYQALMAHWHAVLPAGRILDVHYEDLIGDLEGAARRLIAHCGLEWDARCLDFHRTTRRVTTASASQVRRPVYASSVGRWRRYRKFLGPLIAELAGSHPSFDSLPVNNRKEDTHA